MQNLWVFADPVFGPTPFTGKVLELINTAELTRLRDIKQLSTASLFYPAATHSRFQHSLGMAKLVKDFLMNVLLEEDAYVISLLVYASLVHDIGHAAWGHAGELNMEYRGISLDHANLSSRLVVGDAEITKYFEEYGLPLVSQVLNEEERILVSKLVLGMPPVLPKLKTDEEIVREEKNMRYLGQMIVHSALDFDRLEYLIRDAFYTTTAASFFRLKDVFESLIVSEVGGARELMFGNRDFAESFVITRELMYSGVYQQPRDLVAAEMLARGFNICFLQSADPYEMWFRTDEELLRDMYSNDKSKQIAALIKSRKIYTILYENDFSALVTPTVGKFRELTKQDILKAEKEIAKPELEPWQLIICVRIAKEPKEADAWVMTSKGPELLRRVSPLIRSMTQEYRDSRSRVVLAVHPQTSNKDQNKVLKRFKDYFEITA
jgi:HD superfamily phosphohydrolase